MEFFVPYNMIEFFNQKSGKTTGNFRYVLSQRIYLFLLHKNSGRIHTKDLKDLVSYFGSSKQTIEKALVKLVEMQLITVKGDYYVTYGKRKFTKNSKTNYFRSYKFTEESLTNPKLFKSLIFKYIGQEIAYLKGHKFSNGLAVRKKSDSGKYFVVNTIRDNAEAGFYTSSSEQSCYTDHLLKQESFKFTVTDLMQKQSLSYLGKANNRSSRTISRKLAIAEFNNDILVFSTKTDTISNCGLEHLSLKNKELAERTWVNLLSSEIHSEAKEMLENFKSRLPILGEDTFVSSMVDGHSVMRRKANKLYYKNINLNTKSINKGHVNFRLRKD